MIDFRDISVVVQGVVDFSIIEQVLQSVRNVLPEAEIILSTWEGVDYSSVQSKLYDQLVLSSDPGGFSHHLKSNPNYLNNIDRQIRSSYTGITQANNLCCLKMRTDMILTHACFLEHFEKYNQYQVDYKLVKSRILNNASGARDPFWNHSLHPADFFLFGYTEDLKTFFSAPFFPEADKVFQHNENDVLAQMTMKRDNELSGNKLHPELYLMTTFIQKYHPDFKGFGNYELSPKSVAVSYAYIINNFVMLSDKQLGFKHLKHPDFEKWHYPRSLTNLKWQKLYKLLCDSSFTITNNETNLNFNSLENRLISMFQNNNLSIFFVLFLQFVILSTALKLRCGNLLGVVLARLEKIFRGFLIRFEKIFRGLLKKRPASTPLKPVDLHTLYSVSWYLHLVKLMLQDKSLVKGLEPFMNLDRKVR
ncbi:MAG: hypothetical protein H2174_07370 [Vampirovibrio sp.]|nr:hypothetical protein [Vampirovibrio sp.]